MNTPSQTTAPVPPLARSPRGLHHAWQAIAGQFTRLVSHDLLALVNRIAIAAIFWQSGRTKVEGLLQVTPGAIELFRTEYRLPLLPPEIGAHMAAYAEHAFPLLLVLGLGTRLSALALLGMTAVIQFFVYPDAWPTHLSWAGVLLYLVGRGGGRWSMDSRLRWA